MGHAILYLNFETHDGTLRNSSSFFSRYCLLANILSKTYSWLTALKVEKLYELPSIMGFAFSPTKALNQLMIIAFFC